MKGVTPIILIAAIVGLFVYYINPQYEKIGVLQAQKERHDDAVAASVELEKLRNDLVDRYNSFSTADLRRIAKFLPEQVDDVRLILDIDRIGQENDIDVETIILGDLETSNDTRAARQELDTSFAAQVQVDTQVLPVSFSFDATYDQFLDFITDLETSLRIIDITDLSFESEAGGNIYTFEITLQTYWLK